MNGSPSEEGADEGVGAEGVRADSAAEVDLDLAEPSRKPGPPIGFVLIHGGGQTSEYWKQLTPLLEAPSLAPDLPGRADRSIEIRAVRLVDWSDAVNEAIDASNFEKVVLVASGFAAVSVADIAVKRADRVAHVVFIGGLIPNPGTTVIDALARPVRKLLALHRRHGVIRVPGEAQSRFFLCNDLTRDQAAFVLDRLVPESAALYSEPIPRFDLRGVEKTYVALTRDRMLSIAGQLRQIANLADAHVVTIDSGHSVAVSKPAELAGILNPLAESLL